MKYFAILFMSLLAFGCSNGKEKLSERERKIQADSIQWVSAKAKALSNYSELQDFGEMLEDQNWKPTVYFQRLELDKTYFLDESFIIKDIIEVDSVAYLVLDQYVADIEFYLALTEPDVKIWLESRQLFGRYNYLNFSSGLIVFKINKVIPNISVGEPDEEIPTQYQFDIAEKRMAIKGALIEYVERIN